MLNINSEDYKQRVSEIRQMIFDLADDIGAVYSTKKKIADKILDDAMNRDLTLDEPLF